MMNESDERGNRGRRRGAIAVLVVSGLALVLVLLLGLFGGSPEKGVVGGGEPGQSRVGVEKGEQPVARSGRTGRWSEAGRPAEEVVAEMVAEFGRSRRELAYALARRDGTKVPREVEEFFEALERGDWEEIDRRFQGMAKRSGQYEGSTHDSELNSTWPAVLDAYGAAEQAHLWPAEELLEYGRSAVDALKPGMVYVGGTDAGRWIPALVNESEGGEHIMLTQNALADGTYLDYLKLQYEGRLAGLGKEDSQKAFHEYIQDATRRLEHDKRFPNEPKQVRPGEEIKMADGRISVAGQTAVMAINERLLRNLMEKNPEVSFGLQESFPLESTYENARPLGPLMELGGGKEGESFTEEQAASSMDYWRNAANEVLLDPVAGASETVLKSYSHDIASAANLLAAHEFHSEAEEGYRLGMKLWPGNPEPVGRLADMFEEMGRKEEARQMLEAFARDFPDQRSALERVSGTWSLIKN